MKTFYTEKDDRIDRTIITANDSYEPGPPWKEAPNDWHANHGDKLEWLDKTMHRIPDPKLVEMGKRIDNRNKTFYKKDSPGETKLIYQMDEEPGEEYTVIKPIEKEAYQKWDENLKQWIVDIEKKEKAEKDSTIAEKKAEITAAEQKRLRSVLADLDGTASEEDKKWNLEYKKQIETLRAEIYELEKA